MLVTDDVCIVPTQFRFYAVAAIKGGGVAAIEEVDAAAGGTRAGVGGGGQNSTL